MTSGPPQKEKQSASFQDPLKGRLLFLVGARRSGTNWLQRILAAHPEVVAMPSETHLISHGIQPLSQLFQHASPGSPLMGKTFMERESFLNAARRFLDRVFLENLERLNSDARFLLERTPWHAQHLELLSELYPDAHVIHLIRDGRAVARSLPTLPGGPSTIAEAATEWRDSVACRDEGPNLFGNCYREARYETLLEDPVDGVTSLFEWLHLDLPEDLQERVAAEAEAEFNVDPGSPVVAADKWRAELSAAQLAEIDSIAGTRLRELGYVDATQPLGSSEVARSTTLGIATHARTYARRIRDRAGAKHGVRRQLARDTKSELISNLATVEEFGDKLARASYGSAMALCDSNCLFRLVEGDSASDGRGEPTFRSIAAALDRHRADGMRRIDSHTHPSPRWFTTVLRYDLSGGSRWMLTSVYEVKAGVITGLTLYRYELRDG